MKLDKKERLSLINQYLILEKLYPEEADNFAEYRQVLTEGYESHYSDIFDHLYEGLSECQCSEVLSILNMYRYLNDTSNELSFDRVQSHAWFKFKGFDGNNESHQLSYVNFQLNKLNHFAELKNDKAYYNSHMPTLNKYRAMLAVWNNLDGTIDPTEDQLLEILESGG